MTIEEIRSSSLLEYYALGILSKDESLKVEEYLIQFPALQKDYLAIQKSLEYYADAHKMPVNPAVEGKIFDQIKSDHKDKGSQTGKTNQNGWIWPLSSIILGTLFLSTLYFWRGEINKGKQKSQQFEALQKNCDSLQQLNEERLERYQKLGAVGNRSLAMTATENYSETALTFHTNQQTEENFLVVQNLPDLQQDQAFQLWSLKEGQDPIPLTVFTNTDRIIPMAFEQGTGTYAITIEPAGGSQSPTLSQLIGTVNVG